MNTPLDAQSEQEAELQRRLDREPADADALLQLGWLRLQRGDPLGARDPLLHAHVLQPRSSIIRIYAATALAECGDYRARQMIRDWREWLPLPDQQQYDLAYVMQHTDWTAESIGVLEDLLQRSPDHRAAKVLLAAMYERTNQLTDANMLVDALLKEDARAGVKSSAVILQQNARMLSRAGELQAARDMLEQAGPTFEGDADYFFALGALADRLDDAEGAMEYFGAGHALQVRKLEMTVPHRLRDDEPLLPAAARSMGPADLERWPELLAPDTAHSPVFVVGFPRSGTTLLEQMLDAHPALQAMDERPHFDILGDQLEDHGLQVPRDLYMLTQADCDELRKGYLMMACEKVKRCWDARLVDKNPLNMLWLPLICRMFPNARFVLLLRHPCDVLMSNYMQSYKSFTLEAASRDLGHLARAYVEAFSHWFHHVSILRPTVLTMRYEDLVADPAAAVATLGSFLELDNAGAMLRVTQHAREKGFIGTPSYRQVIEPIHQHAIGRWKRYRRWLGDAIPVLSPVLGRVGYSIDAAD